MTKLTPRDLGRRLTSAETRTVRRSEYRLLAGTPTLLLWGGQCFTCRRWFVSDARYTVHAWPKVRKFRQWRYPSASPAMREEHHLFCRDCKAVTAAPRAKRSRLKRSQDRAQARAGRTCAACGKPIEASRSTRRYCGDTCRQRFVSVPTRRSPIA